MIFNMTGGGGLNLNFNVIDGTTTPVSQKENTIWVNTDTEITEWIFSFEQPESATEGTVWFSTSATSPIQFNAVKKNEFTVYPMDAYQYISDSWVKKNTKTYQNGVWVDWVPKGAIYYKGNECDNITGGWSAFIGYGAEGNYSLGKYTESNESIVLKLNGSQKCVSTAPENKIDLKNASKVIVNVKKAPSSAVHGLYVSPDRSNSSFDNDVAELTKLTVGENVLDVSHLSGKYYIVLNIVSWDSSSQSLEFDEVRIE